MFTCSVTPIPGAGATPPPPSPIEALANISTADAKTAQEVDATTTNAVHAPRAVEADPAENVTDALATTSVVNEEADLASAKPIDMHVATESLATGDDHSNETSSHQPSLVPTGSPTDAPAELPTSMPTADVHRPPDEDPEAQLAGASANGSSTASLSKVL